MWASSFIFFLSVYNVCSAEDQFKISNKGSQLVSISYTAHCYLRVSVSRYNRACRISGFKYRKVSITNNRGCWSILSISNIQKKIAKFLFNFVLNNAGSSNRAVKFPATDWCSFASKSKRVTNLRKDVGTFTLRNRLTVVISANSLTRWIN